MTDKTLRARVALAEIEAMGLTLDDLLAVSGREVAERTTGPTLAEYVPMVADSYQPRSQRTYNSMNPALLVDKPRRLPNRRRALTQAELNDLWAAVAATTKDPELDLLLLRFHLESGARRMGAINLLIKDLDHARQTIWLREKFGAEREQPICRSLLQAVADLATARGFDAPR